MQDAAELIIPCLREIILTPVEAACTTDNPLRDEQGDILLTETGLSIYEG